MEYAYYCIIMTHYGLVMPYGNIDLRQHWLRYWLVAWRHQAIRLNQCWLEIIGIHPSATWHKLDKICRVGINRYFQSFYASAGGQYVKEM